MEINFVEELVAEFVGEVAVHPFLPLCNNSTFMLSNQQWSLA